MQQIKEDMWETYKFKNSYSYPYYDICKKCNEEPSLICKCAELRFYLRLNDEKIQKYIKNKKEKDIQYLEEEIIDRTKELEELKIVLCELKEK